MSSKFPARMLMTSFVLLSSYATNTFANAPLFLWNNQEGISAASMGCEVVATDKIPFKVSQYSGRNNSDTENLRNFHGVRQSHLVNHSIVKDRVAPSKHNYSAIEVVGLNTRTSVKANRWFSERGDQGYLYDLSLRPMEDFVFEASVDKNRYQEHVGNYLEELKQDESVFLRVASGHSYYEVKCPRQPQRTYTVFRAYQRHHHDTALFYLGVSSEETGIFSEVRTYGKVESMGFLSEVGKEVPIKVDEESLRESVEVSEELLEQEKALEDLVAEADDLLKDVQNNEEEETTAENQVEEGSETTAVELIDEKELITTENVVCIGSRYLNVRDQALETVLFKASLGETVKLFQSWSGDDVQEKTINGVKYNFRRVEFANRESEDQKVGFIADAFIKKRSECRFLNNGQTVRENPVASIEGLDDARCCDFPTADKPTHSYTSGMRRFRAGRSGGRLHAACDLYRYKNEPIRSVAPGKVLRNLYEFYQGTYALEVRHEGGFVVRYGEMTGKTFVRGGNSVKMGQRIGNMGKVNSGCCRPMLHFELFSGEGRGALSTGTGRHRRRSDLMDPTPYLLKWQDKVF